MFLPFYTTNLNLNTVDENLMIESEGFVLDDENMWVFNLI